MSPTRTPAVAATRPAGGYPGPDGARLGEPAGAAPMALSGGLVPAGAGCWTVRRPGPRGAGEHVFSELEWPVTTETGVPRSAPSAGPGGVQENLDDIGPVY